MATGTVPASVSGLKTRDHGFSFVKSVDFMKVRCLPNSQRIGSRREKFLVIRNSNPGPETVELKPASEGSPLLDLNKLESGTNSAKVPGAVVKDA